MSAHSDLQRVDAIDRLFQAQSVAIVGASPKGGYVTSILRNLKKWGFSGQVAAVNPRYDQIEGVPCFQSLAAIPFPVDLVVIGVRSDSIQAVLDDCEAAQVAAVEIVSSGFAEEGGNGAARQRQLIQWSERTGIPVVGPNCVGLMSAANGLIALAMTCQPATLKAGGVSLVLQSGMLSSGLLMPMAGRGIGVRCLVTTGNEACVDVADFINYFAEDKDTRVIACYCEQIKRPLEFIKACERAADNNKPIVMIKVGRSEGARKGALAHTGSLVGSDVAIDAVLKKLGVVRVDTPDDLIETAAALSTTKRPRGRRVVFASSSGAAVSLLSDVAESCGIEFPPVPVAVKARLEAILPEYGTVNNPLDLTGQAFYETRIVDDSLRELATCEAYDVIVWGGDFASSIDMGSPVGHVLRRVAETAPDVVFSVMSLVGGQFYPERDPQNPMLEPRAEFDGMPFLQGVGPGLKALSALIGYAEFQRTRKPGNRLSAHRGQRSACYAEAVRILREAKGDVLTEREGKRLLALYGIPVTREALATDAKQAARVAQDLGFPVAMKVESADIVHKTDVGGVALNISSSEQAAATFEQIVGSVRSRCPEANIAGALVQEMAKPGIEMMLGATFDPQFGPVIVFGLGGIWVEALKDVRALMPPFDAAEVKAELGRLRGASVLRGARGGAKPDLEAFADCIVKFSALCSDLADEIGEIDVNPIILAASGTGLTAVDCLITRKTPQKV
ncbi:acetate--CoA ligase family protein [Bradyrhizobium diazoefficiens]|uniref:acetate--CoA ligase family protein n=1 Tax=Bradyrhizobium diazoefficiens TaxID=1355477 RepID=UPI00190B17BD|nr:acetate--CoA ligase family protein [Bradyrhizobium diazoefficiens]QQO35569.1 acetate--CoA ligase family protein [Bradyrhizobium diazoefficiens]